MVLVAVELLKCSRGVLLLLFLRFSTWENYRWSDREGLYVDGSIVRHQGQVYKAFATPGTLGVAAEPGDSDHSRFYVSVCFIDFMYESTLI